MILSLNDDFYFHHFELFACPDVLRIKNPFLGSGIHFFVLLNNVCKKTISFFFPFNKNYYLTVDQVEWPTLDSYGLSLNNFWNPGRVGCSKDSENSVSSSKRFAFCVTCYKQGIGSFCGAESSFIPFNPPSIVTWKSLS